MSTIKFEICCISGYCKDNVLDLPKRIINQEYEPLHYDDGKRCRCLLPTPDILFLEYNVNDDLNKLKEESFSVISFLSSRSEVFIAFRVLERFQQRVGQQIIRRNFVSIITFIPTLNRYCQYHFTYRYAPRGNVHALLDSLLHEAGHALFTKVEAFVEKNKTSAFFCQH